MNHPMEPATSGYLEVISGCMYSGKTEELIRQMKRCEYAKIPYLVFNITYEKYQYNHQNNVKASKKAN